MTHDSSLAKRLPVNGAQNVPEIRDWRSGVVCDQQSSAVTASQGTKRIGTTPSPRRKLSTFVTVRCIRPVRSLLEGAWDAAIRASPNTVRFCDKRAAKRNHFVEATENRPTMWGVALPGGCSTKSLYFSRQAREGRQDGCGFFLTRARCLPIRRKVAVNRPDEWTAVTAEATLRAANGGSAGAIPVFGPEKANDGNTEVPVIAVDSDGGPRRTRTCGPLIKSQLLYQLS
jgi:hypothetical protein